VLELGSEAGFGQGRYQCFVGCEYGKSCPGWHGFSKDLVGIVVIENKYVVVAKARWTDESATLVSVDLTWVDLNHSGKAVVGPLVGSVTSWEGEGGIRVFKARW